MGAIERSGFVVMQQGRLAGQSEPPLMSTGHTCLSACHAALRVVQPDAIAPLVACDDYFVLARQPTNGPVENRRSCLDLLFQAGQREFSFCIQGLPDCSCSRADFFVHLRPQRPERR
jgi:hypothetical protein